MNTSKGTLRGGFERQAAKSLESPAWIQALVWALVMSAINFCVRGVFGEHHQLRTWLILPFIFFLVWFSLTLAMQTWARKLGYGPDGKRTPDSKDTSLVQ